MTALLCAEVLRAAKSAQPRVRKRDSFDLFVHQSRLVRLQLKAPSSGCARVLCMLQSAGYPAGVGSYEELSERGELMVGMSEEDSQGRYRLKSGEPESYWRTFRDCDPSPFKSIFTGTSASPLKGKWMDLNDFGEVSTE